MSCLGINLGHPGFHGLTSDGFLWKTQFAGATNEAGQFSGRLSTRCPLVEDRHFSGIWANLIPENSKCVMAITYRERTEDER